MLPDNIQSFTKANPDLWDECRVCLNELKKKYSITKTGVPSLRDYNLIVTNQKPVFYCAWKISDGSFSFDLCLVEYEHVFMRVRAESAPWNKLDYRPRPPGIITESNLYFFGHLKLEKDFGLALIRPETIGDKITEFFDPVEIDFESHPSLSKNYHILADDKDLFTKNLSVEFLNSLEGTKNLQIEFRKNHCLFRFPKAIDKEECMELCELGLMFDKSLNEIRKF